jgi:small-conductance mechanosensitive channel
MFRHYTISLIGASFFLGTIYTIIKAWAVYFFYIPKVLGIHVLNLGNFNVTLKDILYIFILYFATRLTYILISIAWDVFVSDYLRADNRFKGNFLALTKYILILLFIILAGALLGFTYRSLLVIGGALSVGIGFGLQNIANDFISGIIILFERPIHIGDIIEIDGNPTTIIKIGSRSTLGLTRDNTNVVIPNSQVISQKLVNWTHSDNIIAITLPVGVEYATDMNKMTTVVKKILDENVSILKNPKPLVTFDKFGDSSLDFKIRFWISDPISYEAIKHYVLTHITEEFRKNKITIPYPQRSIVLRTSRGHH